MKITPKRISPLRRSLKSSIRMERIFPTKISYPKNTEIKFCISAWETPE